ncbi:MAG: hypothetical protein GVY16_04815 [Planctomycetes bacterium]|nr:hypothetical protein [Planctomycetota bacterium]
MAATREKAVKAELYELSWQISSQQQELLTRREGLSRSMDELSMLDMNVRRERQDMMMTWFAMEDRALRGIAEQIRDWMEQRRRKVEELARIQNKKDRLSDLRDEAEDVHERKRDKREQEQLDEVHHISLARRRMARSSGRSA